MDTLYETIIKKAEELEPELQKIRRDFHTYAESGWFEIRTSSIIANQLDQLGYQVLTGQEVCLPQARMGLAEPEVLEQQYERAVKQGALEPYAGQARNGFTGVIGILNCGKGPVIAMRFDIDALGVIENTSPAHRPFREGFCSVNHGMMHACGHDGHAAMGLGVAKLLMSVRNQLHGTIKLIFQPAEEGIRGARAIVEHGHLDDVDYVIASHMAGNNETDCQIGLSRKSTLATSKLDITFSGKAAHAGLAPERGCNAMLAAATAVLNIQAIPRCSTGETRINVGVLHAGSGRNVICSQANMELEVRGATTETNRYLEDYAAQIVYAAASMHQCTCEIRQMGAAESLSSDEALLERCSRVCREYLGLTAAVVMTGTGGSEDYSYMVNRVRKHGGQGLYFHTITSCTAPFHNGNFDFEEKALCSGVKVFCGLAADLMGI